MSVQMITGNRGAMSDWMGYEQVGRAARLVLAESLNENIELVQTRWEAADLLFEEAGHDVGARAMGIEEVPVVNIFQGPHKSLAASPIDRFPNVSVTAYASRPAPENAAADVFDVIEMSMLVETMVRAGPMVEAVDPLLYAVVVHRRIERTTEAVLRTIRASGNLLGTVDSISQPRGGIIAETWQRKSEGSRGDSYMMHGSRFTYALTRTARIPT